MYKIKQVYEDFYVEEIPGYKLSEGDYAYFWLEKSGLNTSEAMGLVARKLGVGVKKFGYAGNKDKRAVTKQVCSVYGVKEGDFGKVELKRAKVSFVGCGKKPISLGDLEGNKFEIVVRNLSEDEVKKIKPIKKMINFFDEQRFSSDNVEIGKAIVKGDFEKVVGLLLKNNLVKNRIEGHLRKSPKDFVGAVRLVEKKLLMLFVHAYQSYIWNECVKELKDKKKVPIVGFGSEVKSKVIKRILEKEDVTPRDFIIKQIPEISAEGVEREVFVSVKGFKVLEKGDDELNKGKKKVKISFSLPKGSYGTMVVKTLLTS